VLDYLAAKACRRAGVPLVIVRYVVLEDLLRPAWRKWLQRPMDNWALRRAAGVAFAAPHSRDRAARRLGLDGDRARFISVPVDLRRYSPAAEGSPHRPPAVVGVGQLTAYKGWEVFADAMASVRRALPQARATIYGHGPTEPKLRARLERLGLAGCVSLVPHTPDIPAAFRQAAVYCSTSRREGLSVAAAEAAACGLPLVLTSVSGSDVLVEGGVNGYVEAMDDASAIAARLIHILSDQDLRQRMARASRLRAEALFNPVEIRRQYADLFRQAVDHDD
jgi:glycosyltransferase involved in cell wall biosynthesis